MGLLGFALPAAVGLRMARPERPVLAVVGDGAALYQILSLWSARRYDAGVLFVVLSNGGYAIMDRLAERTGQAGPWPALDDVDVCALARAQGVEAVRVDALEDLLARLDEILPGLAGRTTPLVLEVAVAQDTTFDP
jgi:benzoylformate decarboxylase